MSELLLDESTELRAPPLRCRLLRCNLNNAKSFVRLVGYLSMITRIWKSSRTVAPATWTREDTASLNLCCERFQSLQYFVVSRSLLLARSRWWPGDDDIFRWSSWLNNSYKYIFIGVRTTVLGLHSESVMAFSWFPGGSEPTRSRVPGHTAPHNVFTQN